MASPRPAIKRQSGTWYIKNFGQWHRAGSLSDAIGYLSIIATLAASVSLSSCASPLVASSFLDLDAAWQITCEFDRIPDPPGGYWKSPAEFEADGGGDCEDFATYLLYLLGPDSGARMAVISSPGPGAPFHAIVQLADGTLIEPQIYHGYWIDAVPLWTLEYNTVMHLATNGKKSLDTTSPEDVELMKIIAACE